MLTTKYFDEKLSRGKLTLQDEDNIEDNLQVLKQFDDGPVTNIISQHKFRMTDLLELRFIIDEYTTETTIKEFSNIEKLISELDDMIEELDGICKTLKQIKGEGA